MSPDSRFHGSSRRFAISTLLLAAAPLAGITGCREVVAIGGGKYSSTVLLSDGTVWSWGGNGGDLATGQLGDGSTSDSLYPVQANITEVASIGTGRYHTLAIRSDSELWSWGYNSRGQLGNGTVTTEPNPQPEATGSRDFLIVSGGYQHSVALHANGAVYTFGDDTYGQLGRGSCGSDSYNPYPGAVSGLTGMTAVDAGVNHALAIKDNATVWTWGSNGTGQLGTGSSASCSGIPTEVPGIYTARAVAGGVGHSLALLSDGTVMSWGDNSYGQLGDGTTIQHNTPVRVVDLDHVVAIAAGHWFSMALRDDGTVWTWGANYAGQLGNGTTANASEPVQVTSLTGVTLIAAGREHALGLVGSCSVVTWGDNSFGQLGNGSTEDSTVPVHVVQLPACSGAAAERVVRLRRGRFGAPPVHYRPRNSRLFILSALPIPPAALSFLS